MFSQMGSTLTVRPDFPGSPVVKNLPANAGDMGSGKTPRASAHLSPQTTATEPKL